jgi:hypothetical protein
MAPFLLALVKSGLGLVANAAMEKGANYLEEKTGIKVDLQKEPSSQELTQFKQFMLENETELQHIQLEKDHISADIFKAALADTGDARRREAEIATSDKAPMLNKIITPLLAIFTILLTFILFSVVMFSDTPVETSRKELLIYILGALTTISSQVIAYYFGSSVGSKDKDAAIKGLVK